MNNKTKSVLEFLRHILNVIWSYFGKQNWVVVTQENDDEIAYFTMR